MRRVAAVSIGLTTALCFADVQIEPVAAVGQPVPGIPSAFFSGLIGAGPDLIGVNVRGQIAFQARMQGSGVNADNDSGAWLATGSQLALLIREGDPAPGLPGIQIGHVHDVGALGEDGRVYARTSLLGADAASDAAIWLCRESQPPQLVMREGDPAPSPPGGIFTNPTIYFCRHGDNDVAFVSDSSLFLSDGSTVGALAYSGMQAPGLPADVVFGTVGELVATGADSVGFRAVLSGPGVTAANDGSFWRYQGVLELIAREGDPAPDMPAGTTYATLYHYQADAESDVFGGTLVGPGITSANDYAVFRRHGGAVQLVVREDDDAPGLPPGTRISSTWNLAAGGSYAAFAASLSGVESTADRSMWIFEAGGPALVARESDPAPDLDSDIVFHSFETFGNASGIVANATGRMVCSTRVRGPGIPSNGGFSVFATDPLGQLRFVALQGDPVLTPQGGVGHIVSFYDAGLSRDGGAMRLVLNLQTGAAIFRVKVGCPAAGCDGVDIAGSDCRVDLADLSELLSEFGSVTAGTPADIDGDGEVGLADLSALLEAYGSDCSTE